MKKYLNIAMIFGILLATVSCRQDEVFRGDPEMQFGAIGNANTIFVNNAPVLFNGVNQASIRAVTFTVNPLADEGELVFDLNVALFYRTNVNEPVNFTIALMPETDAQFFPGTDSARSANSTAVNAITINGNPASEGATGYVAVGQPTGSVEVRVDWNELVAGANNRYGALNRVYLLLTSDHPSIPATEAQRRIRLNFTRAATAPAIAAPTFAGASFFFADLAGSVTTQGTSQVIKTGFIYALDTLPTRAEFRIGNAAVNQVDSTRTGHTGAFTNRTGHINENTRVWVRAFAINEGGDTTYSPALTAVPATFVTRNRAGGTTTIAAPNFTLFGLDTVRVIYSLTAVADTFWMDHATRALKDTIAATGIVWQTASTPAFLPEVATGATVVPGNQDTLRMGADTLVIGGFGLTAASVVTPTWLIFRPFATNFSARTEYGPTQAIRVQAPIGVTNTVVVGAVTDTTAAFTLRGTLSFNGGIALNEAGFILTSTSGVGGVPDFSNYDTIIRVGTVPTAAMTQAFITDRESTNTTWHVRAFFRNQFGILVLGEEQSFTVAAVAP
ncbi:MAG: hypothetical protein FWD02_05100 [Bacteroidales bacterium]|nr:hypothetical protein [Bacteroidales bacterium]